MKSKKAESAAPTKSELEILQVLWKHGPSTVRFVNDDLNEKRREVQYTSTLKLMQIMVEKGLQLLGSKKPSKKEMEQIREMLDKLDKK